MSCKKCSPVPADVAREVATSMYWKEEKAGLLHDELNIDFPNAPPGMPQHMNVFGVFVWKDWLKRTVKTWEVTLEEFHQTPGTEIFWAVGYVKADVFWGGNDGKLDTKFIMRLDVKDGKVVYIKQMMDPLKFLRAAGREVPIFRMDLQNPEIDEFLRENPMPEPVEEELDLSEEAIAKRKADCLYAFTAGDYFEDVPRYLTMSPDVSSCVFFLPPEMKEEYSPEDMIRVEAWTNRSCPKITFFHQGEYYPTEDPNLYFAEYACYGDTRWLGNNVDGHYQNAYYYLMRFDDKGRLIHWEEYLNSVNKFNSINVSLPSFPYYF